MFHQDVKQSSMQLHQQSTKQATHSISLRRIRGAFLCAACCQSALRTFETFHIPSSSKLSSQNQMQVWGSCPMLQGDSEFLGLIYHTKVHCYPKLRLERWSTHCLLWQQWSSLVERLQNNQHIGRTQSDKCITRDIINTIILLSHQD